MATPTDIEELPRACRDFLGSLAAHDSDDESDLSAFLYVGGDVAYSVSRHAQGASALPKEITEYLNYAGMAARACPVSQTGRSRLTTARRRTNS